MISRLYKWFLRNTLKNKADIEKCEAQINLMDKKADTFSDCTFISIDNSCFEPELEKIMWKIIKKVRSGT